MWREYDAITRESLCRILGSPMNDAQWTQATLPVSSGGLGLRCAEDHCHAAYISSLLGSQDLKSQLLCRRSEECPPLVTADILQGLTERTGEEENIASLEGATQKQISTRIDQHKHQTLLTHITDSGSVRDQARFNSLGLPNSGAWLNVLPSPTLGLHLRPAEFNVSVKYRLGMKVIPFEGQCSACPSVSDTLGDHAVSCGWGGERIARHDAIRDCLYATCTQAGLGPTREDRALIPGNEARPADIFLPRWTAGKDTALDITVVNPLSATYVNQSAATPGHALTKAYERKWNRHGEACRAAGITFQPLPWDTLGGWGNSTTEEVKKMGSALARHTRGEEAEVIRHLIQRVSVTLMKINSNLILNRSPNLNHPMIDGIE